MRNGELYFAFAPDLVDDRRRCARACERYNTAGEVDRRKLVELFHAQVFSPYFESYRSSNTLHSIQNDASPLPPLAATPEDDEDLFKDEVWCDGPIKMDYGYNVKYGTDPNSLSSAFC